MKKVFSKRAGAVFNESMPYLTFIIKKDCIDFIYKAEAGIFVKFTLSYYTEHKLALYANWGTFLKRISNPQKQLPQLEKTCPTLFKIMTGQNSDRIFQVDFITADGDKFSGFNMEFEEEIDIPLMLYLNEKLYDRAHDFAHTMIDIYNEIVRNCPFPAWKAGLSEVWE